MKRTRRTAGRERAQRAISRVASVALLFAACSSPEKPWNIDAPTGPRPYEAISSATRDEVRLAIRQIERGQFAAASATLRAAQLAAPNDLRVAIWLQEASLAEEEQRVAGIGMSLSGGNSPRAKLRRTYRSAADNDPSPMAWLLAARLEDDQPAAELLLARALELDPQMAWAHYGLAHAAARGGDWVKVHRELLRTFELDPAHLPALRLLAWAQATAGELDQSIAAYEAWLGRADENLLASEPMINTVKLDLALAYLNAGEPERAAELIDGLNGERVDEVRRNAARAATLEALGRPAEAREAAAAALAIDSNAVLPAVQEALLLELWLNDPWAAREAWRRVLALAGGQADVAAGLQRFRAQVHLQRLTTQGMRGEL